MGIVAIPLSSLVEGNALDKALPVEACEGAKDACGTLTVTATFDPRVPVALQPGATHQLHTSLFRVCLGWDVVEAKQGKGTLGRGKTPIPKKVDLDASAVAFDHQGNLVEAVYFDKLSSTLAGAGAIHHQGDSLTGDDVLCGDDEIIAFDTARLDPKVLAVFVCVCAFTDGSFFSDVSQSHCRVVDCATGSEHSRLKLGALGNRTAVTLVRLHRDSSSRTGWAIGAVAAVDSHARSWGFLVPQMKDLLGFDLVPGLKGAKKDRIAILSKGQSFKIADTCESLPDLWCLGLFWNVTQGVNIDLDASIVGTITFICHSSSLHKCPVLWIN